MTYHILVCILSIDWGDIINYTIGVNEEKCITCGICVRVCPTGTLEMDRGKGLVYNTGIECDNLWGCIYSCPTRALEISEVA